MSQTEKKVIIIGAGIAGLCTGVLARRCGYDTEIVEMHELAGGLATSWKRGEFTFETCIHWLLGSNPKSGFHQLWKEVFDIDRIQFINMEEYQRLLAPDGNTLVVYRNVDRMESEMKRIAPEDITEIRRFANAIRKMGKMDPPLGTQNVLETLSKMIRTIPYLPEFFYWTRITAEDYGKRFKNSLLRSFFGTGDTARLSMLALVFSLAWMNKKDAGYPIGGSKALIQAIEGNYQRLGGKIRFNAKVSKVLVEKGAAVGIQLNSGEMIRGDWIISGCDGHETIFDLLGGRFVDRVTQRTYSELETFPSYLQVSLGVKGGLTNQPGFLTQILDEPMMVDPCTKLDQLSFRIFNFDPTFAPNGKTAITCFLPTRNFEYWTKLKKNDHNQYDAEKAQVSESVMRVLEKQIPTLRSILEITDVSTPATVIRFTGNWKGSMEGWLMTPQTGLRTLRNRLPGLNGFLMVGQWVMPGGGLPSGLMTARTAVRHISKVDRRRFLT
ncbi:MAG: phytoene desaturase family protein [Nitrospiria bacterium]